MSIDSTKGYIHSFQSLGTVDGPGVRFVVFFQGCNLRCKCCHNPDTWKIGEGTLYSADEVVSKVSRFKEYFGAEGGVTLSGGEPLLQSDFAREVFTLCHNENINTCLDTSGSVINNSVLSLLDVTDRVLLDIKYTDDILYRENAGCSFDAPLKFLGVLNEKHIPTTLRQVVIPTVNDTEDNILKLRKIAGDNNCVDKIELLPFRKICQTKYDEMHIPFPFADVPVPTKENMDYLKAFITEYV